MQFHVPQFLEVEDKIFSFLTLKQFLYIFGGLSISYLSYTYLNFFIAAPIMLVSLLFCAALAFVRINNKPFIHIVEAFTRYLMSPRLYIWKKVPKRKEEAGKSFSGSPTQGLSIPALSVSKLKDLSWSLDIKEHEREARGPQAMKQAPLLKDI